MGRTDSHGSLRKKVKTSKQKQFEPEIFIDRESDFASIKISPGIEAKSYVKDGIVFSEDKHGRVIEIQVLNLSQLAKKKTSAA